jgi:tetratricopeptide (TPR) repeat protein
MIKKFIIGFMVFLGFAVGLYFTAVPLASELFYGYGKKAEKSGKVKEAQGAYRIAIRIDGANAKYHAELGRFYLKQARSLKDTDFAALARQLYEKAIGLNPLNARYLLGWAEARSMELLNKPRIREDELEEYTAFLKKAVSLEPNSYYVNAFCGYCLLVFRSKLSSKGQSYAIYILRHALELNPEYRNEIYSTLANRLNSFDLLQKITPNTPQWQAFLYNFMQNIDYWKYRGK